MDQVNCTSCGRYIQFAYDNNNKITHIIPSLFWIGKARTFSYSSNGRVSTIFNDNTDKDSLVYDVQNRVSIIYNRTFFSKNGNYNDSRITGIDSLRYDSRGLLASRVIMKSGDWDWATNSYLLYEESRSDFTFDADSNLTQVINYIGNGVSRPSQRFTYGNYDSYKNPLKNIGGINLYFPDIFRYSFGSTMDVNNFAQLSRNNPRIINFYVITSQGTWFLDMGRQMILAYETDGSLTTGTNNMGEKIIEIKYKFK